LAATIETASEVAGPTLAVVDEANRQLQRTSDDMLAVGSALSFGFAAGLLVGGAPRIIAAAAFLPSAMMAMTMFGRGRPRSGYRFAALRRRPASWGQS
jgi:hypothetical protein